MLEKAQQNSALIVVFVAEFHLVGSFKPSLLVISPFDPKNVFSVKQAL